MRTPLALSLRMMLITPAMASEPYCAEEPSRSTSTFAIAAAGICPKSTACEPWLTVPNGSACRLTSAERWRRLPLISTSVSSGGRLRRLAGRMKAVPSAIGKRWVLNEGAMMASWSVRSADACFSSFAGLNTSMGESDCVGDRPCTRVPVTTSWSSSTGFFAAAGSTGWAGAWGFSCAKAGSAAPVASAAMTASARRLRWVRGMVEVPFWKWKGLP